MNSEKTLEDIRYKQHLQNQINSNLPRTAGIICLYVALISAAVIGIVGYGWITALIVLASGVITSLAFLSAGTVVDRQNTIIDLLWSSTQETLHS